MLLHNLFFTNKRETVIHILQQEFCDSISSLTEIPRCGGACNIQEDNIVYEDANDGTSFVNFEMVINARETNLPLIKSRLETIVANIGDEPKMGIGFHRGEISSSKYSSSFFKFFFNLSSLRSLSGQFLLSF